MSNSLLFLCLFTLLTVEAKPFSDYVNQFQPASYTILNITRTEYVTGELCINPDTYYRGLTSNCTHTQSTRAYFNIFNLCYPVDGTPSYMHMYGGWESIPANKGQPEPKVMIPHTIKAIYPKVKVIVAMRHPVDRYTMV